MAAAVSRRRVARPSERTREATDQGIGLVQEKGCRTSDGNRPFKKNRRVLSKHEKVEWVHRHRAEYGVKKGCEIMNISTSTYYYRPKKNRAVREFEDAQ